MSNPPSTYYRMHKALEGYAAPSRGVNSAPSRSRPGRDLAMRITARKSGVLKTVCDPLFPGLARCLDGRDLTMIRARRMPLPLVAALALISGLLIAPVVQAANPVGSWATWTFASSTSGRVVVNPDPAWPTATVTTDGSGTASSTQFLNQSTPIGQVYGSSEGKTYAGITTSGSGATSTTTLTFSSPTPDSSWAFVLGDVDVENVTVSATDASGDPIAAGVVNGWFAGSFSYCTDSTPRPCVPTDPPAPLPTWTAPTLSAASTTNTAGASGWFRPNQSIKTLTLSSENQAGISSATYQLWIASFPVVPPSAPPVQRFTLTIDGNEGICTTGSVSGDSGTWGNLPGADSCTREDYEFVGFNTSADGSGLNFPPGAPIQFTGDNTLYAQWKKIVPEPFMCTADLYQVSGTGGGVLYAYDPANNEMNLVPAGGGKSKAPGANATGYNPADDFIYGIAPSGSARHLWQFGSNGVYADLGPIIDSATGSPIQSLSLISGDFIADDILLAIQVSNRVVIIDIAPTRTGGFAQATVQTLSSGSWGAADIAFTADGTRGYGMSGATLYVASFPGGDASAQTAAAGQSSSYTRKTVQGVPARGTYGASYLDQSNNAYFYNNQERRIYLITAEELAKPQPTAVPLGTEPAFVLGTNRTLQTPTDGASCAAAPIITVTLSYRINGGRGETPDDQVGFVDQEVTVAPATDFQREGFAFVGWNTTADGSGTLYPPGALFDLGTEGGVLFAQWGPVEPAPVVPEENILEPIVESSEDENGDTTPGTNGEGGGDTPAGSNGGSNGDAVIFSPIKDLPAPPNDPWKPSTVVLVDPDGGNPTPVVQDDSGSWKVNNRTGDVRYVPNPVFSGTAQMVVQLQTESGARYQSTLKTQVASCQRGPSVRATVYFDVLESSLTRASKRTLDQLVARANRAGSPTCTAVVGFVQPTPNRSNDISLSTSRAKSVADYLETRGVKNIIRTEGLGRANEQGARARRATARIYYTPLPPPVVLDETTG